MASRHQWRSRARIILTTITVLGFALVTAAAGGIAPTALDDPDRGPADAPVVAAELAPISLAVLNGGEGGVPLAAIEASFSEEAQRRAVVLEALDVLAETTVLAEVKVDRTAEPPPPPPPPPPPRDTQPAGWTVSGETWDALARCESGGNWSANTGNGFHGGLQFHPQTWNAHKPAGYPQYAYQATRVEQINVGERVRASQGWGAWPHCSRQLGLR